MAWLRKNWFVLGLLGAVVLAFVFPEPGSHGGWLHPRVTSRGAVVIIFVLQGLVLALGALREGLLRWRLHVLVQLFTYVVFPLLGIAGDLIFGRFLAEELRLGFLFLAVLPTTVSTAIVFTALAGGNTAGALVNATVSNLLGVVVTPLWVGLLLEVRGEPVSVLPLVRELVLLIVLPLALGQCLRPALRAWVDPRRAAVNRVNSALVLFIVYVAFCGTVQSGVFATHGWGPAGVAALGAALLFSVVMLLALLAARTMRLSPSDRIAALFCAPQKTLASGVPMANLIFSANPALGLILLPVMFYHPIQLMVGALLIDVLKAQTHDQTRG
jgi:sodium/bile acid cotransporter 7